ncbi:4-hydroxy-tetrahydrodipicolinate synthase [Pygmaiobacter massiliensis]|uniref:4-hydroxy-tetrahydrodipicolinate synthase n=1 Tax=Pygmaiobacter massiliensis TaxID=1917873 RepID=UPI002A7FE00A|nr:4-hydroxy-tetrahydrodipicolinate synthase [Pygmaiobacter massiliensis]MDY4784248.1 4-hydroxy-tetrahydrodipicolinate synthase [Pygmaiobacter massiliensis]
MKSCIFTGSCVALVTPMNRDHTINLDVLDELIDFQLTGGTDAILVCGTSGEAPTLNQTEHMAVIHRTVKKVAGRVPVIAGTGSNDTRHAIEQSQQAEALGADALLLVTPYYNKTSQAGLIEHFTAIAQNVSLPVILYNVPSRTGVNIQPETYAALSAVPNIVGVKEANGNLTAASATKRLCGDELALYSGNDAETLPILSLGGKGVISVLANIMPAEMHELCRLFLAGETQAAIALQMKLDEMMGALFEDVNPMPVKWALESMGYTVGCCRGPLVLPNASCRAHLKKLLYEFEMIK